MTWTLEYRARPMLANAERKGSTHWTVARAATREWREAFWGLAKEQRIPRLEACVLVVEHLTATRRRVDAGACFPAAKAAIDGLVDAGVLADDGQDYVRAVTYLPPECAGYDAVRIHVEACAPGYRPFRPRS